MQKKADEIKQYSIKRLREESDTIGGMSEDMMRSRLQDIAAGVMRAITDNSITKGFEVVCDSSNNPQYNVDNGILSVDIRITDPLLIQAVSGEDHAKAPTFLFLSAEEATAARKEKF